jgi:hypothetical protein
MLQPTATLTRASALYAVFAWQIMTVRHCIAAILSEADRLQLDPELKADSGGRMVGVETEVRILAGIGRTVRADFAAVIRHNCAGAVFQIAYSLLENLAKSLGFNPGPEIRCGGLVRGEAFSRVLWASRNAFAHGDEWKRQGPKHPKAAESYGILTAIGFSDPATVNLYDVFALASGSSPDGFIKCVLEAGKDLSDQSPSTTAGAPAPHLGSANTLVAVALGLVAIALTHIYREINISEEGMPGIIAFQHGSGASAVTIPVAEGNVHNPLRFSETLRNGAINRLSAAAVRPYKELEARLKAWYASLDVLLAMNVENVSYHSELMELCNRAEHLYEALRALPDPIDVLRRERGISSLKEAIELTAEILSDDGFTPLPFREVPIDMINFKGGVAEADVTPPQPSSN